MKYDVTVIGSGPGGYVAAIRCAQLGMKTAIIERYPVLGGTCLNVGCIPSKALLDSTEHYHNAHSNFQTHGINVKDLKVDMPQMIKRKNEVVLDNNKGVEFLMKKNKIDVFHGHGSFVNKNRIKISGSGGSNEEIETDKVIIATGSKPIVPAQFNYDKKRVITSTEALNIEKVPGSMVVIGGGVIGLELGTVFQRLGAHLTVIELTDSLLPGVDPECVKVVERSIQKAGGKIHKQTGATGIETKKDGTLIVKAKDGKGKELAIESEIVLVAIG
ncbi:MAG: NAD(P)/FAD-dependent oxidoreductase, partial [Saprospiraceae bacterium]|nr:NAD(P)/FAD-dependent oxidoreductase [Saprospiraceae bacterium]